MNPLPTRVELDQAAQIVYANMVPTPQYPWPLLRDQLGFETWLKHKNPTPTGAFKIRGGLVYFSKLIEREPNIKGVISDDSWQSRPVRRLRCAQIWHPRQYRRAPRQQHGKEQRDARTRCRTHRER